MATNTEANNLLSTALETKATPVSSVDETHIFTFNGTVGSTVDLYALVVDASGAISYTQIASSLQLDVDTDLPTATNEFFGGGVSCFSQDTIPFVMDVTDATSGVIKYTVEVNSVLDPNEYILPTVVVSPDIYTIKGTVDVGSAAGTKTVIIRIYDQANNIQTRTFSISRTSQSIIWNYHTAARSSTTPFKAEGDFEAFVTNSSISKINGFFPTTNYLYSPVPTDFDTTIGAQITASQQYETLITESNVDAVLMYVQTDSSPNCYGAEWASITPIDYSSLSVGNPNLNVFDSYQREYTNTLTNSFQLEATGGSIGGSAGSYPNGDLIIGYMLTESASSPGAPPTFNTLTNKFEDSSGVGWTVIEQGATDILYSESLTFSNSSIGYKNVYLWVATMGHSGMFAGVPAQVFSASAQIYYIDDFQGPTLTNPTINSQACTLNSGTIPNQIFNKNTEVTSTAITVAGTLTDDKTKVVRWVVGNYGSPPNYTLNNPGAWTMVSPPTQSISFSYNMVLPPPNSVKTVYVYAVDSVGNISQNQIRIALNDPNFTIPDYGIAEGQPYKFEGKSSEHTTRETIASMFGDGVNHVGFISKRTSDVQAHRIHKLSEYRGMRVQNTITEVLETLPAPNNPLKFSDFLNRRPRLEDLRISPHQGTITTPVNIDIPVFEGDTRNIALTVDIDTGNVSTPHIAPNNDLVDIDARWFINFLPENSGSVIPQTVNVSNGLVQSFNFSTRGVYVIIAYDSFGGSVSTTYRIYSNDSPPPPVQDPPIDVEIDIGNDPNGTTPATAEFFINQVCLAVDAALCVDRSGSYVPGFSNAMYNTLSDTLDAIAAFSEDENGNTDARYAMIWYWNPYPGGIEATQNWTTSKSAIISAVAKYKDNGSGGREPKLETAARAAMGSSGGLIGDWRKLALKLVMLYSDEPDSPNQRNSSSPAFWADQTGPNYYANRLLENEVALVLFDAGVGNASKNGLPDAISRTSHLGSTVQTLGLGASPSDIVSAVNSVFDNYKNGLSFDIQPDITTPALIRSKSANAVHGSSAVPIAYNSLVPSGSTKKAVFDLLLDNAEINNVGTDYISTFITIKNSSNLEIARKELRIKIKR